MTQGKTFIIVLVALVIGFGAGFVLRPVIVPVERTAIAASPPAAAPAPAEARGKQYFTAHIDEARQVMTQCTEGTVRGDECLNAEMAVTEADARERHKRFFGN